MKTVYYTKNRIGADMVKDYLIQNGIQCMEVGNALSYLDVGDVEIRVNDDDEEVAIELLKDFSI